jgi:putative intracellular protease/amidase
LIKIAAASGDSIGDGGMFMTAPVLVVLTSHSEMGDTGKPTGFWLEELAVPYYAFRAAGREVVMASPDGGAAPLDPLSLEEEHQTAATRRFQADDEAMRAISETRRLEDCQASDFALLFYPGGHGPMWDLAACSVNAELASAFVAGGKPVGAVCHGPAAFLAARKPDGRPLVAGETVTCFSNREEEMIGLHEVVPFLLEDRLRELGADFVAAEPFEAKVAGEGLVLSGQNPASSAAIAAALLARVARQGEA